MCRAERDRDLKDAAVGPRDPAEGERFGRDPAGHERVAFVDQRKRACGDARARASVARGSRCRDNSTG
jgi:hypothetical protein